METETDLITEVMNANDLLVIALFDGWKYDPERWEFPNVWIEKSVDGINRSIQVRRHDKTFVSSYPTLKYDTSWDWLMPVVEKIEKLDEAFDTRICFHADEGAYFCDIVDQENNELACQSSYTKSKIEVVYQAVLEFIEWYNNQKATS